MSSAETGANGLPDYAIEIRGLKKTYRGQAKQPDKIALKGIDLMIPRGSLFGLLGPNGAGKSTLINILGGLVIKSGGTAKIWDIDIDRDPRQARAAIGIVPQELNLDAFFTPRELLDLQAGLYGVPKNERRTMELLETVGLADKADAYSRTLSGGMRRRLMVAKAMVHAPPVLVLDEPTAGVDIELRQSLWANVKALNEHGVTVLLTTHYLEEAEELCDTIGIINHGELVAREPTPNLLKMLDSKSLTVTLDRAVETVPEALSQFDVQLNGPQLTIHYKPSAAQVGDLLAALQGSGLAILDLSTEETDLEDIFLQLTRGAHAGEFKAA